MVHSPRRIDIRKRTIRALYFEQCERRLMMDASGAELCETVCVADPPGSSNNSGSNGAAVLADFALADVNPNSATFEQNVSPRQYLNEVSVWYFSHATCTYCRGLFGYLDAMQDDLATNFPGLSIRFLGVNEVGEEADNSLIVEGRDAPWLQDVDADGDGNSDAWQKWSAAWRDVVIVNGSNKEVDRINLTTHNLAVQDNYDSLRDRILNAAISEQRPFCNWPNPLDANNDSLVNADDVWCIIDDLNAEGSRALSLNGQSAGTQTFYDVNFDGFTAPNDCLIVINRLIEDGVFNSTPLALGETYSVPRGQTLNVSAADGVLKNDSDANRDSLTAVLIANPSHGSLTFTPSGGFTYTPAAGFSGADSFQYAANDGSASSGAVTVTIEVAAINSPPQAVNDAYTTAFQTALTTTATNDVLTNDTDTDGDPLTVLLLATPGHGTVTLSPNGTFTYAPSTGFSGADSFQYTVNDGNGGTAVATVSIQVQTANTFAVAAGSTTGAVVGSVTPTSPLGSPSVYEFVDSSLPTDLRLAADDHFSGDASARVVLIEYLDIQCPPCGAYNPIVRELESQFAGDLLVIRRHLPLTSIHANAFAAAIAAEAADRQGAFDSFIDLAYENQSSWSTLSNQNAVSAFESFATALGLNLVQFRTDVADPTTTARVQRDMDAAIRLGVNSTPTFFLDGQKLASLPGSAAGFATVIQTALDQSNPAFELDRKTGQLRVANSAALNTVSSPIELNVRVNSTTGSTVIIPVRINVGSSQ